MCCPQIAGVDMVTTFSLRASDGAIRWTTDSKAAGIAAELGTACGEFDCSGSIDDETWILSSGFPNLWRRLSSGSTQAEILGDGSIPTVTGDLFRVLTGGALIHGRRNDDSQTFTAGADPDPRPPFEDYTVYDPKFTIHRLSAAGAVEWTSDLEVGWPAVRDRTPYYVEITEDGWVYLMTAPRQAHGRWWLNTAPSPDRWEFTDTPGPPEYVRVAWLDAAGDDTALGATFNCNLLHPYSYSYPSPDAINVPVSPPDHQGHVWAEMRTGGISYNGNSNGDALQTVLRGTRLTAYRQSPALWTGCQSGAQGLGNADGFALGDFRFTFSPGNNRTHGLHFRDAAGAIDWSVSHFSNTGPQYLFHGTTGLACSGDDLYALSRDDDDALSLRVHRVSLATGTVGASIDVDDHVPAMAKLTIAWDGGYAMIYNRFPYDVDYLFGGVVPVAGHTREAKANGVYIFDRDLTTSTWIPLPHAAYRVLAVCSEGEERWLVVGHNNLLIGIDVTDPTAPVVTWRRVGLYMRAKSAQADGANITFGIVRTARRELGTVLTSIPDWSDVSLPANTGRLAWSQGPNGSGETTGDWPSYQTVEDNSTSGYELPDPGIYLGDFITVRSVPE